MRTSNYGNPASEGFKQGAAVSKSYTGKDKKEKDPAQVAMEQLIKEKALTEMMNRLYVSQVGQEVRLDKRLSEDRREKAVKSRKELDVYLSDNFKEEKKLIEAGPVVTDAFDELQKQFNYDKRDDLWKEQFDYAAAQAYAVRQNPKLRFDDMTPFIGEYVGIKHGLHKPEEYTEISEKISGMRNELLKIGDIIFAK